MEKCELTPLTNMRSLLIALAKAMNLINPNMQHHHEQTAYIAYQIGYEMGLRGDDLNYAVYAALLHDIGAVVLPDIPTVESIEEHSREIAAMGARLIRGLEGFGEIADIIEASQNTYIEDDNALVGCESRDICMDIAQAVHIADFVTSQIDPKERILNQVKQINEAVIAGRNTEFSPKAVDAYLRLSERRATPRRIRRSIFIRGSQMMSDRAEAALSDFATSRG